MWKCFLFVTVILRVKSTLALWDRDVLCPKECTCRLEHVTELAINRFIAKNSDEPTNDFATNNEVLYEEDAYEKLPEDQITIKSATCVLLTDIEPLHVLDLLPSDIESLTLIQGYKSGNKTFKFTHLSKFADLMSLELLGTRENEFVCEIDTSVANLKYLNLERVLLRNSKTQVQKFVNELNSDVIAFEYVQKFNPEAHPLTFVQKGAKDEVVSYNKYVKQEKNNDSPLFIGFAQLFLLRIANCELNNVHWQMFEGLGKLKYLLLEKNNLRFIPDFAFYGTPNLKSLSLAYNNLLSIQITDLAGLLELEYLDLSHNNFSQLSELSLPPFPKLKLANFADNPISVIYPYTFEVMNTTDSLVFGGEHTSLGLLPNSFAGLDLLKKLTINYMNIAVLKRDLLIGMPNLKTLILTGNISEIQYDAFAEVSNLETLILSNCNIYNMSMDSFIGLEKLVHLDLSKNQLSYLPPGIFDPLPNLRELYLNNNKLTQLPKDIFLKLHAKLIRLNENPWHCSCDMSGWKPMVVNRMKQKSITGCEMYYDKTPCAHETTYKYVYNNKLAPKCATPDVYANWIVFHVMRWQLKCAEFKPKLKKIKPHHVDGHSTANVADVTTSSPVVNNNTDVPSIDFAENEFNELSPMGNFIEFRDLKSSAALERFQSNSPPLGKFKTVRKLRKAKKS